MTKPTPHGQVPEALIDLIDAYAETRHRCGGIYNARTEAARNAVIEALSGVQALSAAPEAIAKLRHLYQNMVNGAVRDTASAKRIAEGLLAPAIEALERATPPAEQPQPHYSHLHDADAVHGKRLSVYSKPTADQQAAPQPAPAPLSDDTERLEWLLWKLPGDALRYVVGELADTSSGSEFRAAIDAALAAQGGKT